MPKFPRLRSTYLWTRRYVPTKAQREATREGLEYHEKSSLFVNVDVIRSGLINFIRELNLAANRKLMLGKHTIKKKKGRLFTSKKELLTKLMKRAGTEAIFDIYVK